MRRNWSRCYHDVGFVLACKMCSGPPSKNTINSILCEYIDRKYSIYVAGEYEQRINFLGLMGLLERRSDFFQYTTKEQKQLLKEWLDQKYVYVDADIIAKISQYKGGDKYDR